MASHLVGQHQQTSFATPVNGAAGDATVVLGNDNATVTTYNAHDIDPTIHVQDSTAATFAATPAATAGRKWMTNDAGAVYLYLDTGSAWVEVNYQRTASTGAVVIVSTTAPQLTVEYDGTHTSTFSVSSAGALTINATSTVTITPATTISGAVTHSSTLTQTGLATFNGGATVASGQTLTVTGVTITGLTAASVATGTFPGVYTVTGALTLSAALTYGGVTLSNAVTGTGNMVLSASPTLTGTLTVPQVGTTSNVDFILVRNSTEYARFSSSAFAITAATSFSNAITYGGVTLSNAVTGTGNMVLSASPTFTGTITAATAGFSGAVTSTGIAADDYGLALQANSATVAQGVLINFYTRANRGLGAQLWGKNDGAFSILTGISGATTALAISAAGAVTFAGALSGITTLAATGAISNSALASGFTMGNISGQQRISYDGTNFNFLNAGNGSAGVVGGAFTGASFGGVVLSGGAGTFAGAVSGITTLAGTGAVSGFTSIALGTTPSTTGLIRIPNNQGIYGRNNANTADKNLLVYRTDDLIQIGSNVLVSDAGAVSGITTLAGTGAISGFTSIAMNGALSGATTISLATTIGVGGTGPAGTGSGVSFPVAQSASADPNTLDDYEEGNWTPSIGGTATYTAQTGRYIKVGKKVSFWGNVQINTIGSGAIGTVSGLPFASATGQFQMFPIGYFASSTTNTAYMAGSIASGASSFTIIGQGAIDGSAETINIFQNGTIIYFAGEYEAAN